MTSVCITIVVGKIKKRDLIARSKDIERRMPVGRIGQSKELSTKVE